MTSLYHDAITPWRQLEQAAKTEQIIHDVRAYNVRHKFTTTLSVTYAKYKPLYNVGVMHRNIEL